MAKSPRSTKASPAVTTGPPAAKAGAPPPVQPPSNAAPPAAEVEEQPDDPRIEPEVHQPPPAEEVDQAPVGTGAVEQVVDDDGEWETVRRRKRKTFELPREPKGHFYLVKFHPMREDDDDPDVWVSVNGEPIACLRNREVAIRGEHLSALTNALTERFQQLPGEDRQSRSPIQTFTFDLVEEIEEAEYREMAARCKEELERVEMARSTAHV